MVFESLVEELVLVVDCSLESAEFLGDARERVAPSTDGRKAHTLQGIVDGLGRTAISGQVSEGCDEVGRPSDGRVLCGLGRATIGREDGIEVIDQFTDRYEGAGSWERGVAVRVG